MPLFLVVLFGSAVFGVPFFKMGVGPVNALNLSILYVCLFYFFEFRRTLKVGNGLKGAFVSEKYLWLFFVWGVIVVGLSYAGIYREIVSSSVLVNLSYVPRQAYYLLFIPFILLVARKPSSFKWLGLVSTHWRFSFLAVYIAHTCVRQSLALDVPSLFCLAFLLIVGRERDRVIDLFLLALLSFSPIATGGEMTQMTIRAFCVVFYFVKSPRAIGRLILICSIGVAVACFTVPILPLSEFGLDANSIWRAQYWKDEITQLLCTYGFGVGYGTSYATQAFIGAATSGPFSAIGGYTVAERIYVVGCHNSFISLAFRLGVIGIGLLFCYLVSLYRNPPLPGPYEAASYFSLVAAIVIVCFNVGFETPSYFFIFAFSSALYMGLTRGLKCGKAQRGLG